MDAQGTFHNAHYYLPVELKGRNNSLKVAAMVDCGASATFVDRKFAEEHCMVKHKLRDPILLYNIDGSRNMAGDITEFVCIPELQIDGHMEKPVEFLVTELGKESIILGMPWLRKTNPQIDWETGQLHFGSSDCESAADPETEAPFAKVTSNHESRRKALKAGILEHSSDGLWIAANFMYSQRIAERELNKKPKKSFEEMVPEQYQDYAKVFAEVDSQRLPDHKPLDHSIDLKPDAPETIRSKVYPMPVNEQAELDKFLEEHLRIGTIVPSKSPMGSPVFFVKKKDGKLWLVQDYQKLNEFTIKNTYPLPLAADIINRLQSAKYFTKFDVRWGYHNIQIKKGDKWKAVFTTNQGLFEPLVMLFGLTNLPATFQTLMNTIFADLVAKGVVGVYLDDILIFTATLEEHRQVVHEVLKRLQDYNLYLRPEKCEFEQKEVEYLGLMISKGKVRMDLAKVEAVTNWKTPSNLKEVRGFIGFANFYRRFIE